MLLRKRSYLILLCPEHHHAIHDRGWTCTGTATHPTFTRPDGTTVTTTVDPPDTTAPAPRATAEHPAGNWQGDRIDWDCFSAAFHHHVTRQAARTTRPTAA